MLNTEDFIKRLEFIMEHFGLSASGFADKISVQRSSISHLLSGRNKPSLDFVMKILDVFPALNLYWLLDGSGSYLKNDYEEIFSFKQETPPTSILEDNSKQVKNSFAVENFLEEKKENVASTSNSSYPKNQGKEVEKIVFFYSDGTFEDYKPSGIK